MEDEVSKVIVSGDCRGVSPAEALLDLMSRPETGYGPDYRHSAFPFVEEQRLTPVDLTRARLHPAVLNPT